MDAEDQAPTGGLRPGDLAPDFQARTTMGERRLADYRGRWLVLFSHPADFTPVCASEFVAFARAAPRFEALDCALLGLSVDSLFAHLGWMLSLEQAYDLQIPFPVIEDPSMAVARAYGMTAPGAADSSSVRATFFIDPKGVIRAISWYPMTTGRSVEELLRLLAALQATDATGGSTPEGWTPGEALVDPAPVTLEEARERSKSGLWYLRART